MSDVIENESRAKRLKGLTTDTHESLDKTIMAKEPFASVENYARFLKVQYLFHRDIYALYDDAALDALLPDLQGRRRFDDIAQDIADVGAELPAADGEPYFHAGKIDLPTALGWLYVAEGSNLGAAFLLKFAAKLGLDASNGARHLAPADEGRGLHWKTFTKALDEIPLTQEEEDRVTAGAKTAFIRVHGLVKAQYEV
ncbi:MAG: biliverdin-producing heme oxygenase [Asticcacaulis sp.]